LKHRTHGSDIMITTAGTLTLPMSFGSSGTERTGHSVRGMPPPSPIQKLQTKVHAGVDRQREREQRMKPYVVRWIAESESTQGKTREGSLRGQAATMVHNKTDFPPKMPDFPPNFSLRGGNKVKGFGSWVLVIFIRV
jgi:hypothetical protein